MYSRGRLLVDLSLNNSRSAGYNNNIQTKSHNTINSTVNTSNSSNYEQDSVNESEECIDDDVIDPDWVVPKRKKRKTHSDFLLKNDSSIPSYDSDCTSEDSDSTNGYTLPCNVMNLSKTRVITVSEQNGTDKNETASAVDNIPNMACEDSDGGLNNQIPCSLTVCNTRDSARENVVEHQRLSNEIDLNYESPVNNDIQTVDHEEIVQTNTDIDRLRSKIER